MNQKKRFLEFDILKAICIILVVIGHYVPENSPTWYIWIHDLIYAFHMLAFMFASGYLYLATFKNINYLDFIAKKFQRLIIPYLLISNFIIITKLFSSKSLYLQNAVSLQAFYQQFYLPVAGFFLWFLFALFVIFLFVPFFNTSLKRSILLIFSVVLFFLPYPLPSYFCLAQVQNMLVYFVLGVIAYEYSGKIAFLNWVTFIIATLSFFTLYLINNLNVIQNAFLTKVLAFLIALTGIWAIWNISKFISIQRSKLNAPLFMIGISSFTIYLLHTTFEGFMKAILKKIQLFQDTNNTSIFLISTTIVILFGIVGPILIEKKIISSFKFLSFIFGVKYSSKQLNQQSL